MLQSINKEISIVGFSLHIFSHKPYLTLFYHNQNKKE